MDGTLGAGGHSAALIASSSRNRVSCGFDQDPVALSIAKERLKPWEAKIHFIQANLQT